MAEFVCLCVSTLEQENRPKSPSTHFRPAAMACFEVSQQRGRGGEWLGGGDAPLFTLGGFTSEWSQASVRPTTPGFGGLLPLDCAPKFRL